jgi:hypothetical protein
MRNAWVARDGWRWSVLGLVAAGLTLARTARIGFVGHDNYPILIASRIRSWADFVGTFTEPLMDGRYAGEFYRPLLNLSFAVDHALWGTAAWGFQLTNAILFAGCGWAVHVLARTVQGPGGRAHWLAPLVFLLHPSAVDVVPVAARRPEVLCAALMALSAAVAGRERPSGVTRAVLGGFLAALAIAAKETGYVVPLVAFGVVWMQPGVGGSGARTLRALRRALPHAAAAGLVLAVRWSVLGGIGGSDRADLGQAPARVLEVLPAIACRLVSGWGALPSALVTAAVVGGVAAAMGAVLAAAARGRRPSDATQTIDAAAGGALRLVGAGVLWMLLTSLPYAAVEKIADWYLLVPAVGWALLMAGTAAAITHGVRAARRPVRGLATAAALGWVALVGWQSCFGLWIQEAPQWRRASEIGSGFLDELRQRIDATPDGSVIRIANRAQKYRFEAGSRTNGVVFILAGYSVRAWAELEFPERRIRVEDLSRARCLATATEATSVPQPDELLILLERPLPVSPRSPATGADPPAPGAPPR